MPSSSSNASDQTVDVSPITAKGNASLSTKKNQGKSSRGSTLSKGSNSSSKSSSSSQSYQQTRSVRGGGSHGASSSSSKSFFDSINGIALGMIETRGMVPAIEAADAMTKAAEVSLIAREYVGGGYVTVMVRGETGAVNASVRAGADACERVGDGLVAAHIIARPDAEIEPVLKTTSARRL